MAEKLTKCVVILGGGIGKNGNLPSWSVDRCESAIEYYYQNKHLFNIVFIPTSGGTYHYPNPIDKNGFTVFECDLMAKYLLKNGIHENNIFREYSSYDTIGNGFFVKSLFTDIRNWTDVIVITSKFHLNRSKAIFDFLFLKLSTKNYKIQYIFTNDKQLLHLDERIKREENSLVIFNKNMSKIYSMEMFHKWLYSNHECYKSNQKERKIPSVNLLYC